MVNLRGDLFWDSTTVYNTVASWKSHGRNKLCNKVTAVQLQQIEEKQSQQIQKYSEIAIQDTAHPLEENLKYDTYK